MSINICISLLSQNKVFIKIKLNYKLLIIQYSIIINNKMPRQIEVQLSNRREHLNPEQNDDHQFEPVTIRFKLVYTTSIRFYTVCPDWTTRQLIDFVKPYIMIDFGLTDFDIVVAGQPMAENGDALRMSSNIKVSDITNHMNYLCFYVRPIPENENEN